MNVVQRQAEPARHRKLAMLFLLPALYNNTQQQLMGGGFNQDAYNTACLKILTFVN